MAGIVRLEQINIFSTVESKAPRLKRSRGKRKRAEGLGATVSCCSKLFSLDLLCGDYSRQILVDIHTLSKPASAHPLNVFVTHPQQDTFSSFT